MTVKRFVSCFFSCDVPLTRLSFQVLILHLEKQFFLCVTSLPHKIKQTKIELKCRENCNATLKDEGCEREKNLALAQKYSCQITTSGLKVKFLNDFFSLLPSLKNLGLTKICLF